MAPPPPATPAPGASVTPPAGVSAETLYNNAMRGDAKAMKLWVDLQKQFCDSLDSRGARNNEPLLRTVVVLPSNGREKKLK